VAIVLNISGEVKKNKVTKNQYKMTSFLIKKTQIVLIKTKNELHV
jgi:hypothetical protein